MIRPRLDAARLKAIDMLQHGHRMCWRDLHAMVPDASKTWAHQTLKRLHHKELVHVVQYKRGEQGPAMPVFAWGKGKDARKPKKLSFSVKSKRWRDNNPDKVEAYKKAKNYRRRKTPPMDPIHAMMLGFYRRGTGWAKSPGRDRTIAE